MPFTRGTRYTRLAGGGGVTYDADALTLFAAMTTPPDATRKQLISDTIASLKTAGVWAKLDELWAMAAADSQAARLGWKRYKDLTAVNSPTFTADQGYAGNGTTSYLNTNFVPSTDGVQYTLNDASLGMYSRTDSAVARIDMEGRDASNVSGLVLKWSDNKQYANLNALLAGTGASATVADSLGLGVARRTASNAQQAFRNGSSIASNTTASSGRPSVAIFIGAQNANGTPANFTTRQYAMAFVGAGMTPTQQSDLYTITQAYLAAIGASV